MARTALTVQTAIAKHPGTVSANAADFTLAAGDAANGNYFVATGKQLIIARNTGAGARTITLTSSTDSLNRLGTITAYSIGAGEFAVFTQGLTLDGWRQSDGQFYIDVEHAEVTIAVITLPD